MEADEADVHEYACDGTVTQYMDWGPNTAEHTRERLGLWLDVQQQWPRDEVTLAIELISERKVVGCIRLGLLDRNNRAADLGFVLNRRYWNRGFATESARAVLDRAFSLLNLHRVFATCDTRNVGSWRVMEKSGMHREGLFRRNVFQKGEWRDSYLYARLEEDEPQR